MVTLEYEKTQLCKDFNEKRIGKIAALNDLVNLFTVDTSKTE